MSEGYDSELKVGPSEAEEDNGVFKRLEELRLSIEDPELSEDELRVNNQLQEDELLAMESIYGDSVVTIKGEGGLRSFQICVHVATSNELTISAEIHSSNVDVEVGGKAASRLPSTVVSDKPSYRLTVQYLQPVVFTCILPKSYPSHLPPSFTIAVEWLDSTRISKLCCMLDTIWMDQPRQEVLYQWVEWLHSSSLSYLGIDKEIYLGPYNMSDAGDRRALSGCLSAEADIFSIMNYNEFKCCEIFRESLHECCICFCEYTGTEFMKLPCKHFFCSKCMEKYAHIHLKEGKVNQLTCPDTKCRGLVPSVLLKSLLGDEEFVRWESLLLRKTLDSMSDVFYCPRCQTICLEEEGHHAQCTKCFFSFCTLCTEQLHVGRSCMTPEMKLRHLEAKVRDRVDSDGNEDELRQMQNMMNEISSVTALLHDTKQCPSCNMTIYRIGGCNKMTCTYCGKFFCYRCGQLISGYNHFTETRCTFFPVPKNVNRESLEEWEGKEMENNVWRQELIPVAGHAHSCPFCQQFNAKKRKNNHITCWSCKVPYCYVCRKMVRNPSEHYGPNGCRETTVSTEEVETNLGPV